MPIASAAEVVTAPTSDAVADEADRALYAIPTRPDQSGRIVALVTINGRGPFRFMLDTGSNRTVLARSVLAKLGLVADGDAPMAVTGINGSEEAPSVHIDSLDAGALNFRDLRMPVLSGPVLAGLDGILGMDGFAGLKLSADFTRDQISISVSRGKRAAVVYSVIPVEFLSERLLMAEGRIGRVAVKAIIDTGSPHTLGNAALLAALTKEHRRNARFEIRVIDATQTAEFSAIGTVPSFSVGPMIINNLDVHFGSFKIFKTWGIEQQPALLVGMDVLGTLERLSIDYRRREVALLPRDEPSIVQQRWFSLTH